MTSASGTPASTTTARWAIAPRTSTASAAPAAATGASAATQADSATSQVKQSKKQHEKATGHQKAYHKAAKDQTKSHGHSQGAKSKKSKEP